MGCEKIDFELIQCGVFDSSFSAQYARKSNFELRSLYPARYARDIFSASISSAGVSAGFSQSPGNIYYMKDALGSVTDVADGSGNVIQRYNYSSFGKIESIKDGSGNDITASPIVNISFTYTGRELEPETGMYYYRARYYDANIGRFIQEDRAPGKVVCPITVVNKYIYSANVPTLFTDPSGEIFGVDDLIIIAVSSFVNAAYTSYKTGGDFFQSFVQSMVFAAVLNVAGVKIFDNSGVSTGDLSTDLSMSNINKSIVSGSISAGVKIGYLNYLETNGFSKDVQSFWGVMLPVVGVFALNEANSTNNFMGSYNSKMDLLNPKNLSWNNVGKFVGSIIANGRPEYN